MPIVASLLLRGTLVMVHPCRIQNNVGALDDNSFFSFSHEIHLGHLMTCLAVGN